MMLPSLPPTLPTVALSCPWCNCPSSPGLGPQVCQGCRGRFTLSPGPALDASVVAPPPHPSAYPIHLKWSIVVTYRFARLEQGGITSGTLDPVVAVAPIDQVGIAFPDVMSIAVWRKLGWVDCVIGALVPLPIALFSLWGAILCIPKALGGAAIFGAIAVAFGLLAFFLFRRGAVTGKRQARITGRYAAITVPFSDNPAFHAELFRRCGLAAPPIP
jgi:hypothetical protein